MMSLLLISSTISLTLTLYTCASPFSLVAWIWLLALSTTLTLSFLLNSWFSFILFLIYVGGMLIMFMYFASIAPNQMFTFSKPLITNVTLMIIIIMTAISHTPPFFPLLSHNLSYTQYTLLLNPFALILLVSILLLALITVTKIAHPSFGPLRPYSQE